MKLLISYIQNFLNRAGGQVFLATVFARLFSFLASWIALQLIPNKELGIVLFAYTIVSFLIPISGFGLEQGLLRYGAILKSKEKKENLFLYVLKSGIKNAFSIALLIISIGWFIPFQFKNTYLYLVILSFILVPHFVFGIIKTQFRLQHRNKDFALIEVIYNTILVVSVLLLSYFYQEKGYAAALLISPILVTTLFYKKLKISFASYQKPSIINRAFWFYGFFASLSNVVTQLLFSIDILLIGFLLNDPEKVTSFRYISLIPFSVIFLPQVFITTDFVSFTERIREKKYIYKYIKSYMLLFFLVSLLVGAFSFLFADKILALFDSEFTQYTSSFLVLIFGVSGILIFRGLFGNLLSSIGKASVNFYIISAALLLNIVSNYLLIPKYGILGAAITSAFLMWFTGIFSMLLFFFYYKSITK